MSRPATKIAGALFFLAVFGSIGFFLVWSDAQNRQVAQRTLLLGLGAGLVAVPLGALIAWV